MQVIPFDDFHPYGKISSEGTNSIIKNDKKIFSKGIVKMILLKKIFSMKFSQMAVYFRNENFTKLNCFYILTKSKTFYKTDTAFIFLFHFKYKDPF